MVSSIQDGTTNARFASNQQNVANNELISVMDSLAKTMRENTEKKK